MINPDILFCFLIFSPVICFCFVFYFGCQTFQLQHNWMDKTEIVLIRKEILKFWQKNWNEERNYIIFEVDPFFFLIKFNLKKVFSSESKHDTKYSDILDKIQRQMCNVIGPDLTSHLQSLSHRRAVASLCLFYKYFHGNCSDRFLGLSFGIFLSHLNRTLAG